MPHIGRTFLMLNYIDIYYVTYIYPKLKGYGDNNRWIGTHGPLKTESSYLLLWTEKPWKGRVRISEVRVEDRQNTSQER